MADWWLPATSPEVPDDDLAALLAPQPPHVIEVVGRPRSSGRATVAAG